MATSESGRFGPVRRFFRKIINFGGKVIVNFAVQRPFYVLAAIIVCLPLTALEKIALIGEPPGHLMFGNLFVDFKLWDGFWFGFALFGAVWGVMLTACLNLDGERDLLDRPLCDNLDKTRRRVTIPMNHVPTFIWFTFLGAPGLIIVTAFAEHRLGTLIGVIFGAWIAYRAMQFVAFLVACRGDNIRIFPWGTQPQIDQHKKLTTFMMGLSRFISWLPRKFGLRAHFFKDKERKHLKVDHFFAAVSLICLSLLYFGLYRIMKPDSWTGYLEIESLPPAAFIFALLLPLIWLIGALWFFFRPYRIILVACVIYGIVIYWVGERRFVQSSLGGPAHTFDLHRVSGASLSPSDVLSPWGKASSSATSDGASTPVKTIRPTLIIVAASGGGILAAAWGSKVLVELHHAYPKFREELRLISGVSGGSVAAAHYVSAHGKGTAPLPKDILREIVDNSMKSSLSMSAYGFAFPDFRRAVFPIGTDYDFDRGWLLEGDWRRAARELKDKYKDYYSEPDTKTKDSDIHLSPRADEPAMLMSQLRKAIREGSKPAVIFNATVLETGQRILFTPISSLQLKWAGWDSANKNLDPERYNSPLTYSEFVAAEKYEDKDRWSVDLWTAARLSATFSYVSPAARANFFKRLENGKIHRDMPPDGSRALQHLIDGGYHDNSGVASALDWLSAVLENQNIDDSPFDRIALVEIRAKPYKISIEPASEWKAAWLGPPSGILNSWDFAQTSSYDTAVNRMIHTFKTYIKSKDRRLEFQSFVFVPVVEKEKGPLSWRLSNEQKHFVCKAWLEERNQKVLQAFLGFVEKGDTTTNTAKRSTPLHDCPTKQERF